MYNFLSRYVSGMSSLSQPLWELAKGKKFEWKAVHNEARFRIQDAICSNLRYFDTKTTVVEVKTDVSQYGPDTQLIAGHATIALASRSLSDTKRRYSQRVPVMSPGQMG